MTLPGHFPRDRPYVVVLSVPRVTLLAVMAMCATARATERAEVVLRYARTGAALKACPDEGTFRALVAARLGYDPFAKDSALALRVEFRSRGAAVEGSLGLTSSGVPKGDRTMSAAPRDCYELAASLALAAAVAVDPEGARAHPEVEPTASSSAAPPDSSAQPAAPPPPPTPPSQSPPAPPPPRARTEHALAILLDGGPVLSVGLQPGPAVGLRLGGGARFGPWSVRAEAAAFLPSERGGPYGVVSAHALYGSLVPCAHPGSPRLTVDLCAVVSIGALFSDAKGVERSRAVTDRYTTIGPRLGFTLMLSDSLGFMVNVEAPVNLSRVHLFIDDAGLSREVWAAGRVGFVGGASLVLKLQ